MCDGVRINTTRHYFKFDSILPDLGGWEWYIRNHGLVNPQNAELRSMYTSVTFIINEDDDRVLLHFKQITQFYLPLLSEHLFHLMDVLYVSSCGCDDKLDFSLL